TYEASVVGPTGLTGTVTPASFSIAPGATQEITVEIDTSGVPASAWAFARVELLSDAVGDDVLEESFTDEAFPPAGWTVHRAEGAGTATWTRTTVANGVDTAPAGARRGFGGSSDGNQDEWLIGTGFAVGANPQISFRQREDWPGDYGRHSVWASSGSCDPDDGEFVEIAETGVNVNSTLFETRTYPLAG